MERARPAGAVGLIATLDWSFSHGRDWGSPAIPDKMDLKTMMQFAPEVLRAPAVARDFARSGGSPTSPPRTSPRRGEPAPTFFGAYGEWMQTAAAVLGGRRVAARGVGRPVHAQGRHAGSTTRRRPSTPASPRSRSPTTAATTSTARRRRSGRCPRRRGGRRPVEVLLDGGIRRGSDVVKAVALGARAVMIGRAYLWGLAANGQAGVENVLDILRGGIDSAAARAGPLLDPRPLPGRSLSSRRHSHERSAAPSR